MVSYRKTISFDPRDIRESAHLTAGPLEVCIEAVGRSHSIQYREPWRSNGELWKAMEGNEQQWIP